MKKAKRPGGRADGGLSGSLGQVRYEQRRRRAGGQAEPRALGGFGACKDRHKASERACVNDDGCSSGCRGQPLGGSCVLCRYWLPQGWGMAIAMMVDAKKAARQGDIKRGAGGGGWNYSRSVPD